MKLDMLHIGTSDVWIGSPDSWPDVTFPDICTYLPSPSLKMTLRLTRAPKLGNISLLVNM